MIISNKIWISAVLKGIWELLIIVTGISVVSYFTFDLLIKERFEIPGLIPSVLGTALAFFIGFNNNQAYDRWWEARKIWGSLVNDSRTWARQIINYTSASSKISQIDLEGIRTKFIHRHIAFLYALKENLRGSKKREYKKYLSTAEFELVETKSNKHNAILNYQSEDLDKMLTGGVVDGFRFIELNKSIISFCDEMGKSERIKNTIFPSIYYKYTKLFIWVLVASVTIVSASFIGPSSIFIGILIGSIYIITLKIGLALLNPFEEIITGVSLNQITRTIEINLLETMNESEIPEPEQSVNNEYIM